MMGSQDYSSRTIGILLGMMCVVRLLCGVSHTLITLISKVKNVQTMKDLRPIGLNNVLYKIISKVLTMRLQPFMNSLIGAEQSVFTKDRLISDNILLCHEIFHNPKNQKKGMNYGMATKLDINKVYDTIEWVFLKHMLRCFGFDSKWIRWIIHVSHLSHILCN